MGPTPRLIDLSVARRADRAHLINGFVGTDAYMAPEQADPGLWPTIGPKPDTWGLAATLYYAIAKRLPHSKGRHDATGVERFPQLVEAPAALDPMRHSPGLTELIMAPWLAPPRIGPPSPSCSTASTTSPPSPASVRSASAERTAGSSTGRSVVEQRATRTSGLAELG